MILKPQAYCQNVCVRVELDQSTTPMHTHFKPCGHISFALVGAEAMN